MEASALKRERANAYQIQSRVGCDCYRTKYHNNRYATSNAIPMPIGAIAIAPYHSNNFRYNNHKSCQGDGGFSPEKSQP